ncbi:beta/gamma crystallin family protein [Aerophototrophica crusticola]|uniref:Beta/gamma crystallin family protein n=1 Tax=Aerophototrophica crusticola TaxID=1709002 RepID=A0A858RA00_9PROT|nr:beta/gamma crystallin family protein [Rhodospirillaceae bacterium B3]
MKPTIAILGLTLAAWAGPAAAGSVTLFSEGHFRGERLTIDGDISNLSKLPPWNDRARSLVVNSGVWEVCKHKKYKDCVQLRRGARVADLGQIGYFGQISSLRQVGDDYGWRGRDRDRDWDDDRRWPRDPDWRDDDWRRPPPPPPPPPRWGDRDWDRDRDWGGDRDYDWSSCQRQVYDGLIQRYGYRARARFSGFPDEGTVWFDGQPWQFRCRGGRVNIWQ